MIREYKKIYFKQNKIKFEGVIPNTPYECQFFPNLYTQRNKCEQFYQVSIIAQMESPDQFTGQDFP